MDKNNENETPANDIHLTVDSEGVALPEVHTHKVDPDGDFHKEQDEDAREGGISFDAVAIPEFHTGKCPEWDPDCE